MQMGAHAANIIAAESRAAQTQSAQSEPAQRNPRRPFHYRNKGTLATIGRAKAVLALGNPHLHGFIAWVAWAFVHILDLIGFRNKVMVMLDWAWSYLFFERGARLITNERASTPVETAPPPLEYAATSAASGRHSVGV